jgi:hypothetical protein
MTPSRLGPTQLERVFVDAGGPEKFARLMANLAQRESGGRPTINNRGTNKNGTVDWGLWQINDIWRKDPVVGPLFKSGAILTPEGNARAAVHILKVQGPKAWATYQPGTDAKYLGGFQGGASSPASSAPATQPQAPGTPATPAVDNSAARGQLVNQFLHQHGADPLQFAMGIRGLQDTPGTPTPAPVAGRTLTRTATSPSGSGGAQNALAWAAEKIGNKETGTNSGGLASYANQRFGMSNAPWCAMFTSLAVTKGGAPSSARTASVAQVLQKAQAGQGYVKGFIPHEQARAGDLIAFGTRHIGMIASVDGHGRVTMIAGNDSDQVQRRPVVLGADATIVRPAYGHK